MCIAQELLYKDFTLRKIGLNYGSIFHENSINFRNERQLSVSNIIYKKNNDKLEEKCNGKLYENV